MHAASDVAAAPLSDDSVFVVDATQPTLGFDPAELWRHRELIWILAARDIKVRYRQAVVGIAWVVLQPLAQMALFSGLFALLGKRPTGSETLYGVSAFCGLILWQLFASIVIQCTTSLVDNRHLLTKVYFPRLVLPLSACLRPLVDFCVGVAVLVLLLFWYRVEPTPALVLAPLVVVLTVLAALSLGLWLSALNAHYRDFGHIVPFFLQLGLLISPVVYETTSLIPPRWQLLYSLNPMASLLELFRWSVLGVGRPSPGPLAVSVLTLAAVWWTGAWYFRRVERFLSDRI